MNKLPFLHKHIYVILDRSISVCMHVCKSAIYHTCQLALGFTSREGQYHVSSQDVHSLLFQNKVGKCICLDSRSKIFFCGRSMLENKRMFSHWALMLSCSSFQQVRLGWKENGCTARMLQHPQPPPSLSHP